MPKALVWTIAAIVVVILLLVWSAESKPVRITIINQGAATIRQVALFTTEEVEIGELRGGESRSVSIPPGETLIVMFTYNGMPRNWTLYEPVSPGTSLVLEVTPQGRVRRATPSISSSSSLRQMSAST